MSESPISRLMPGVRILIHGHFGMRNVGDDAMLEAIVLAVRERCPEARIAVAAGEDFDRSLFERENLSRVPRSIAGLAPAIPASDVFMIGGGTHLHSRRGRFRYLEDCFNQMLLLLYARGTGAQCWMVGVGLGAFETRSAEMVARICCATCSFLSTRDAQSYGWLTHDRPKPKYSRTIDPAYWLPLPNAPQRVEGRLCISALPYFRNYGNGPERDVILREALECFVERWLAIAPGNSVVLSVFNDKACSDRDVLILDEVYSRFRETDRVDLGKYHANPAAKFTEVAECSHALVMRYHAAVFSHLAGIPMISLNYHQKNASFSEEIGLPEVGQITVEEFTREKASELADSLFLRPMSFVPLVGADQYRTGFRNLV